MPSLDFALARHRQLIARQRYIASAVLVSAWDGLPSYDRDQASGFARRVGPAMAGAHTATVAATTAFVAHMIQVRPPPVQASTVGTVPDLAAPFLALGHALNEGRPYAEAVRVGRSTASASGASFVQSTARQAGDAVARAAGRRVLWQRVAEGGSCAWCAERDGTIYTSAADGDYGHDRCGCNVVAVS